MNTFALNRAFEMKNTNYFSYFTHNNTLKGFLAVLVTMGISQGQLGRNPKPHLAGPYCNSEQRFY